MISGDSLRVPFPSKAELLAIYVPRMVENLYDLWAAAHEEAMDLLVRLPEVFGDPPRPAITLHVARGYDDEWYLTMERGLELTAMDPEQHWYEVTAEAVQDFQEYFSFSDDEGWRFIFRLLCAIIWRNSPCQAEMRSCRPAACLAISG